MLAAASGTLAHVGGYFVLFRDAHAGAEALHRTGHDYLGFLAIPLIVVGVAGVALAFGRGYLGAGRIAPRAAFRFLLPVQVAAYLASELAERGLTGELFHTETLVVWAAGIGLQVIVASAAAMVYVAAERAGAAVSSARRPRFVAAPIVPECESIVRPRRFDFLRALAARAPPSAAS